MSQDIRYFELSSYSGSTDTFRTALGSFFTLKETTSETWTSGFYSDYIEFNGSAGSYPNTIEGGTKLANPYLKTIVSRFEENLTVEGTPTNYDLIYLIDPTAVIPNYKYPARVTGKPPEEEGGAKDDNEWKAVWIGGTWGENTYNAIYNEDVFDDNSFKYPTPYPAIEANRINALDPGLISDSIEITYDYNRYFPNYEKYVNSLDSELLIPNLYMLQMHDLLVDTTDELTPTLHNFTTLDGAITTEKILQDQYTIGTYLDAYDNVTYVEPVDGGVSVANVEVATSVLTTPLSEETQTDVKNNLQNIIFGTYDSSSPVNELFSDAADNASNYPYYMKIKFPTETWETSSDYQDSLTSDIVNNSMADKFLKTIKEIFTNQLEGFQPKENPYSQFKKFYSASVGGIISEYINMEDKVIREIDYLKMLGHMHNDYISQTSNCCFVEEDSLAVRAAMDTKGTYRYFNCLNVLKSLRSARAQVYDEFVNNWLYKDVDIDGTDSTGALVQPISKIYQQISENEFYTETVAYRVEKIGGPPEGDGFTQNTLQNFWFLNRRDLEDLIFYDTQVKYGKDYTYRVYAYEVSIGVKYRFSDLAVTRKISQDDPETPTQYCLEFYNPYTGEPADYLWQAAGTDDIDSSVATTSQLKTSNRYFADFYVNVEPSVKLMEVPIYEKTLKILDHPPNRMNVSPTQYLDNSQRLGFGLKYETFTRTTFPSIITTADEAYKSDYLHANDMLPGDIIDTESRSKQEYLQIFRLAEEPKSIRSFDGNLLSTIKLKANVDADRLSYVDFADRIQKNQKYYYLFRIINESGAVGQLTEIYQAELVSDGGFKFSLFNTIFESSLDDTSYTNPSLAVKKLMQLQPNISHLTLDTSNADFSATAQSQLDDGNIGVGSVDDLIWDKKFKIRLTSKKTGKKIDLNITYKLQSE